MQDEARVTKTIGMDNIEHETMQTQPDNNEKCKCADFSSLHIAGFNRLAAHEQIMEMQAKQIQHQEGQIVALYLLVQSQLTQLQNLEAQMKCKRGARTAIGNQPKRQTKEDVVVVD